jgi:hypothetical protein
MSSNKEKNYSTMGNGKNIFFVTLFPIQLAHMQYFPISEEDDFT